VTLFLLLRHAAHDKVHSILAGRMPGILLGPAGLEQARRFAERLKREGIAALYCSPRERTRQTAEAIALASRLGPPRELEALDEVDVGAWSGRSFAELEGDPAWRSWNEQRGAARTPSGESFADVQRRVTGKLEELKTRHPEATVGLVTHAEVIRAAVLHHLRMAADEWWRIEISPASITRLAIDGSGARLLGLNEVID
jgi:probable phosphoglycerate mutase